jgi:hypothetical protein
MNEKLADPSGEDSAEAALRRGLARGDGMITGAAPVLRHLLAADDNALFAEVVMAQLRGVMADIAGQLSEACQSAAGGAFPFEAERLAANLADCSPLLCHLHASAIEWQIAERLAAQIGLDPVLSPLLQALIASDDPAIGAAAMKLLAAQARFVQRQRRMQMALGELPGDVLHAVFQVLRAHLAVLAEEQGVDATTAAALAETTEAQLRAGYDESATRLGLLARMVTGLGGGALAALSLSHAGAAIFSIALALATSQRHETCVLAMQQGQQARLALSLRAAGLKVPQVEETLLSLHPAALLPPGFDRLSTERASQILARGGVPAPMEA